MSVKIGTESESNVIKHGQIYVIRLSNVIEFQSNGQFLGNNYIRLCSITFEALSIVRLLAYHVRLIVNYVRLIVNYL